MVEVFSAPLPDYPNFGVWRENPPGCWTPPSELATGKLPFTEAEDSGTLAFSQVENDKFWPKGAIIFDLWHKSHKKDRILQLFLQKIRLFHPFITLVRRNVT